MELRRADILAYSLRRGDATSQHAFALARALQRHAREVALWVHYPPGPLPDDIAPLVRQTAYADYPADADLTVLEYPLWYPLAERFWQAAGVRVFWYHGVTPPHLWPEAERDFLRNSEVRSELAWAAHCVVATSPFTADELARHSHYPRQRIRIVPLGVDVRGLADPPPPGELETLRRRLRLQNQRALLYVGRVAGNKRIDLAIDALARLRPDFPDLHLLVVGDTQDGTVTRALAAHLQAQAHRLGLAQAVTFTGRVPDIAPYFHLAEVYLQPSDHEGFGVPLVEAMAAGVPIVASASGAMPWVLEAAQPDAAAGLTFAPGSTADLARQAGRVLADPDLRRDLVARGRQRAEAFTLARFEAAVDEVVAAALAASQTPDAGHPARPTDPLLDHADTALRGYQVRSRLPVVGRWVAWLRTQSMTHFKEAYLDRVVEQQVNFNRLAARHLLALRGEIDQLRRDLDALKTTHDEEAGADRPAEDHARRHL